MDAFDLETWVEDLELVVDTAGLERFPLLGLSQGGAVAIAYAVRHPERVTRLVLVGAYARGRLARAKTAEERDDAALDLQIGRVAWRRDDPAFRQVFAAQFFPGEGRATWDAFNALQRATTSTENVVRFLDTFANIDVAELATRVQCPTLVLHARDDRRVPTAQARELARLIPDSSLRLLDSAQPHPHRRGARVAGAARGAGALCGLKVGPTGWPAPHGRPPHVRCNRSQTEPSTDELGHEMNKGELKDAVAEASGLSGADAERALEAVLDTITKTVAKGDKVTIPGFGTFEPRERSARTGRNPQTGAEIQIAASTVPGFKAGAKFKAAVNG